MFIHILADYDKILESLCLLTFDENDHHTDYSSLLSASIFNKHFRNAITDIHTMTDPTSSTEPILLNASSLSTPASENLIQDFLSELTPDIPTQTIPSPSDPSHIIWRKKTESAVKKSSLPLETKKLMCKAVNLPFDKVNSEEGQFLLAASPLNSYARSNGFAHFHQLHFIVKRNLDLEGEKRGKHSKLCFTCFIKPTELAEISLWLPQLLVNDSSSPFKKLLFTYMRATNASITSTSTSSSSTFSHRSKLIQSNCHNIVSALLQNQPSTCSINHLAVMEQDQVRFPPRRVLEKALRAKDLSSLENTYTYSCFWCPVMTPRNDEPVTDSLSSFRPEITEINAFRLHCFYSEKELNTHVIFNHICREVDGDKLNNLVDSCLSVLPCRKCVQLYIRDKQRNPIQQCFVCCLGCYHDHTIDSEAHRSCPLVSLYSELRKNFDTQQCVLALIDKYFRVQCPCCNALFGSYDLLVEHCRRCFCQIMSQSRSYAIPLDTDLFFSTPYLSEKEEIEERTHCIQQMGKLISDLRSHQPATFNLSDGQKRSLASLEATFSLPSTNWDEIPSTSHPPSTKNTLKRTKGNHMKNKRQRFYSDDEIGLEDSPLLDFESESDNQDNDNDDHLSLSPTNTRLNSDDEDTIEIIKIVPGDQMNDSIRIKPETQDLGYDKALL